eukprot:COSAG01_NODE_4933_length_4611_cov_20.932402_4_plen_116_part_00
MSGCNAGKDQAESSCASCLTILHVFDYSDVYTLLHRCKSEGYHVQKSAPVASHTNFEATQVQVVELFILVVAFRIGIQAAKPRSALSGVASWWLDTRLGGRYRETRTRSPGAKVS